MRLIDPDKGRVPAEPDPGADECSTSPTPLKLEGQIHNDACELPGGFATAPISHLVIHTLAAWC